MPETYSASIVRSIDVRSILTAFISGDAVLAFGSGTAWLRVIASHDQHFLHVKRNCDLPHDRSID